MGNGIPEQRSTSDPFDYAPLIPFHCAIWPRSPFRVVMHALLLFSRALGGSGKYLHLSSNQKALIIIDNNFHGVRMSKNDLRWVPVMQGKKLPMSVI